MDRVPDAVAVDHGAVVMTYAEVDAAANHVATELRVDGVGIDANVVVCAERSADYLVALLGIHKAAGCYVPISPAEAPRRAAVMLKALAPAAVIADAGGRRLLRKALRSGSLRPAVHDLHDLAAGRSPHRPTQVRPAQAGSYIIHTSGSTGVPKPAVLTNDGLTNHLWQMIEYFELGSDDCVAQTGPVSFDISVWQLLTPLVIGARVRHFFNLRHLGRTVWAIPVSATVAIAVLAILIRPQNESAAGTPAVPFARIARIVDQRCTACHSQQPTKVSTAPRGIKFDTPEEIKAQAAAIEQQAVETRVMPLGNVTGMTQAERDLLGRWIAQGARIP